MENPGGDFVRIFICWWHDRWYNCDVLISSQDTEELFCGGTADDDRDTACGAVLLYESTVVNWEVQRDNNLHSVKTIRIEQEQRMKNTRGEDMGILGNILWFIFGGFAAGLSWVIAGIGWCITIIGIPIGLQCFKFAGLAFFPFGKEVTYGGGAMSFIANIFWLLLTGIPMAIADVVWGCILCITIIGIPFGKQFFKLAKLSLMPFGATVA